jgi:hypothetical protein
MAASSAPQLCGPSPHLTALHSLQRPLIREGSTKFLVLRILTIIPLQTAQSVQQLLEFHIECARDHARGLLEVTPSVLASAEHPLHDVTVVLIHAHGILPDLALDSPLCCRKGACPGDTAFTPPGWRVTQEERAH